MKKSLITITAIAAALISSPLASADDVVFIGGTGLGPDVQVSSIGGTPTGLVDPFVAHTDTLTIPAYDNAPWANPQSSVPLVAGYVEKTGSPAVIIGLSKGAQVAHGVEAQDTRTDTRYVFIGDPDTGVSRAFGLSPAPVAYTHDVDIVVAEYDGIGDFPDRPGNLLAVANAVAGWVTVHPNYGTGADNDPLTNLADAEVTTSPNPNGTTTTHTLIPTKNLPLTEPARAIEKTLTGQTAGTDALDRVLRPVIDAGYSRNDKPTTHAKKSVHHDNATRPKRRHQK